MDSIFCLVVILAVVVYFIWLYAGDKIKDWFKDQFSSGPSTPSSPTPRSRYTPPTPPRPTNIYTSPPASKQKPSNPYVYRPSSTTNRNATIKFNTQKVAGGIPTDLDLKDLVDPLTGVSLKASLGLYQCQDCKVFYQTASYEVIRAENGGRCVSCRGSKIVKITEYQQQRGRNAEIGVVTLDNYREYIGQVVTFKGDVKTVRPGRFETYAVMFEDRSWVSGFKMVVFRGKLSLLGGPTFLFGLIGKTVKVRGLIIKHETYGYEIIISDPAMILSIQ